MRDAGRRELSCTLTTCTYSVNMLLSLQNLAEALSQQATPQHASRAAAFAGRKLKEDLHGLDIHMIKAMEPHIGRAKEGDVLVIISGGRGA